ncbi:MAG: DUF2061 domain-containing protein [Patescibacteria group bacterium]
MNTNNLVAVAKNSQTRAVAKTITWRILATLITGIVVYLYTGEFGQASKITLTAALILTVAYYLHEEFWQWIRRRR